MSLCLSETVTNNHESGFLARLGHQFHVWADRWQQRHELTHWSDRDLHDVGLSWSEVVRKPRNHSGGLERSQGRRRFFKRAPAKSLKSGGRPP